MATEVAAFLLKEKLQNLGVDQTIIYPKLKGRISTAINNLQQLLTFGKDTVEDQVSEKTKLLSTIYSAEDTIDTYLLRRAQQKLNQWSQKEVSKGLKKFNGELMRLPFFSSPNKDQPQPQPLQSEVLGNVGSATSPKVGSTRRWERISHLLDMESEAVVQKQDMEELVKDLIPPVVGPGGSGKTTMVRLISDRIDIKQHFECCAWVCVSRDFNVVTDQKQ